MENIFETIGGFVVSLVPMNEPVPNRGRGRGRTTFGGAGNQNMGTGIGTGTGTGTRAGAATGLGLGIPPSSPPPEEAVQSLMGLGFDRGAVLHALSATNNNVEAAANRLLGGQ